MKEQIKQLYRNNPKVSELINTIDSNDNISCIGLSGSSRSYVVAAASETLANHNLIICSDKESAAFFYNDLENIFNEKDTDYSKKKVLLIPFLPRTSSASTGSFS